ncbi:MAG: endolytic transglycosylase MltG [Bacteroides sp.]|nr:endolytic transglycosylase MltG [Bacteroides sp.]
MKAKKIIGWTGCVIAALAVAGFVACKMFLWTGYQGDEPRWIYVHGGETEEGLKATLGSELGTAGERAATLWSLFGGDVAKAHGAYRIAPGSSPARIYRMLKNGAQTPVKLTFNNIRTMGQLAARVAECVEADSAAFMAACDSVLPPLGFKRAEYAAAFLPDTYEFYWTSSPEKIVERLSGFRNSFWNDDRRAKAKALGLTPVQVATVASIAEEETNDRQERGIVARLYLNRVHKGMKLQADPTVKYAVGDFALRRITGAHLGVNSPYNTYRVEGLPPGPIRVAAAATLDAVLDSKPHDYLYMCAKEDFSGRHNFAKDYATHQENARRYHKALNARGIK